MSYVPNITSPVTSPLTMGDQQLGTEGFDFLKFLLGLQANQKSEWWQTSENKEVALFVQPESEPQFGQDAALPIVADAGTDFSNVPVIPSAVLVLNRDNSPVVPFAKPIAAPTVVKSALLPEKDVPQAGTLPVASLLSKPVEKVNGVELQKVVETVWKDVVAAKVEPLPEKPQADTLNHHLLRVMASKAERPERVLKSDTEKNAIQESPAIEVPKDVRELGFSETTERVLEKPAERRAQAQTEQPVISGSPNMEKQAAVFELSQGPTEVKHGVTPHAKLIPQVSSRVENLVQQGGGKVTVALDPPEMGRVTIEVTTRGKQVEVAIRSDNDQACSALESGLGDLRMALQASDLQLTHAEVHTASESSFSSLSFGQESEGRFEQGSSDREGGAFDWNRREFSSLAQPASTGPALNQSVGRLDVRV